MANAKRKCPYCSEYNRVEDGLFDGGLNRVFCNEVHKREHADKGSLKQQERRAIKFVEAAKKGKVHKVNLMDKPLGHHWAITKKVCQEYARKRDLHYNRPCIACNKHYLSSYSPRANMPTGGHWKSGGAHKNLQFNLNNINFEHSHCNSFDSDHLANMRDNLIDRVGLDKVLWLESNPPYNANWSDKAYLSRMRSILKKRIKRYE